MAELIRPDNAPESLGSHPAKSGKFAGKIPVIMQMEAVECGAACLAMVCAYHNKWVGLSQVREDYGVGRDGVNVGNLTKVARSYGFGTRGYRFSFESLKTKATFPCIVHWDFEHFVVLRGFKRGKAYLNDPAAGEICMSEAEARKHFTGVCLCLAPDEGFLPEGSKPNPLREALTQLAPMRSQLVFISACVLVLAGVAVVNAYASQIFLDSLGMVRQSQLVGLILILLALAPVSVIAQGTQVRTSRLLEGPGAARLL